MLHTEARLVVKLHKAVAATILAGAIAGATGVTFVATEIAVSVHCPGPAISNVVPSGSSGLLASAPAQPYDGKQF